MLEWRKVMERNPHQHQVKGYIVNHKGMSMRPKSGTATPSSAGSQPSALRLAEEGGEVLLQHFSVQTNPIKDLGSGEWKMVSPSFFFSFWKEWNYLPNLLCCGDLTGNNFYKPKSCPGNLKILGGKKKITVIEVLAQLSSSFLSWRLYCDDNQVVNYEAVGCACIAKTAFFIHYQLFRMLLPHQYIFSRFIGNSEAI